MRRLMAAAAAVLAITLGVTGCGQHSGNQARSKALCETALKQQLMKSMADGSKGSEPASCKGLPDKTIQALATSVLAEVMGNGS